MARPRKPTALHMRDGTSQPSRLPEQEAKPEAVCPDPPERLSEVASVAWATIVPKLAEWRVLTEWDLMALEQMCMAHATVIECDDELQTAGYLIHTKSKNGQMVRKNPLVEIRDRAMTQFRQFATQFGLTPASRGKVSGKKPDADAAVDDWLRAG